MNLISKLFVLAALAAGAPACVVVVKEPHAPQEWHGQVELGQSEVNYRPDADVIPVANQTTFSAIGIHVTDGDLEMYDLIVEFGDGQRFDPALRNVFREGSWSRRIDLPGGRRHIRKVEFKSRTLPNGKPKARVHLFGFA
jgi:hypothetical protein